MIFHIYCITFFLVFLHLVLHISAKLVSPAPADVQGYSGKIGQTYCLSIIALGVGKSQDKIWGNHTYTSDSKIQTSVVHDGWAKKGETVQVIVEIVKGQDGYDGTTRNGITSTGYGVWSLSYTYVDYCCKDGQYNLPGDSTCSGKLSLKGLNLTIRLPRGMFTL